jgi:hypothetical protein
MHPVARSFRTFALVALLCALSTAFAQSTWTQAEWTDPATDAALPAITTPIEFGPDGLAVFACEAEGAGGLTFALQSDAFAAAPEGELTMNYRMDTGPQIAGFATWTRSDDRTVVRFAGTEDELGTLIDELTGTISPAFFWVIGPMPTSEEAMEAAQEENRVAVVVLESQGFAEALAGLPCGP